jgi:tRNA G18 (ribose-2'-O)-methylase SpoU
MRKLHHSELNRKLPDQLIHEKRWNVAIVMDNIRSQHNIGSVFRTSDAFMIEAIHLCGICATPPNKEIHKSALGATETVPWFYHPSTLHAIEDLKEKGYQIIVVEQTSQSIPVNEFKPINKPIALVFGNEVNGVSEDILPLAHYAIEIPQFGSKHSFNVSVCAGIILYDLFLKMRV